MKEVPRERERQREIQGERKKGKDACRETRRKKGQRWGDVDKREEGMERKRNEEREKEREQWGSSEIMHMDREKREKYG